MKTDLLFDVVVHMLNDETAGTNFKGEFGGKQLTLNPRQQATVVNKAIQAFMHGFDKEAIGLPGTEKRKIQAFWGSSDLPQVTKDVFTVFNQVPNYDLLWQEAFKGISLKKGELSWEIDTLTSGVEFKLVPEGGKVEFHKFEGTATTAKIQKYGAGTGVTWETVEGRKLHKFVEQMEMVRAALYTLWANIHYGLLATAGATNQIAWQGIATQSQLDRDIQTINYGYLTLGAALKDSGYGDLANARMLLYGSPALKSRWNRAFRATDRDKYAQSSGVAAIAGDSGQVIEYNVEPRYTYNTNIPANKGLLVLPGNKIQNAVYLNELGLSRKEIESLNELRTYWTAFGAIIGDNDQVYELSFA